MFYVVFYCVVGTILFYIVLLFFFHIWSFVILLWNITSSSHQAKDVGSIEGCEKIWEDYFVLFYKSGLNWTDFAPLFCRIFGTGPLEGSNEGDIAPGIFNYNYSNNHNFNNKSDKIKILRIRMTARCCQWCFANTSLTMTFFLLFFYFSVIFLKKKTISVSGSDVFLTDAATNETMSAPKRV
jgi:hypothetical protein